MVLPQTRTPKSLLQGYSKLLRVLGSNVMQLMETWTTSPTCTYALESCALPPPLLQGFSKLLRVLGSDVVELMDNLNNLHVRP